MERAASQASTDTEASLVTQDPRVHQASLASQGFKAIKEKSVRVPWVARERGALKENVEFLALTEESGYLGCPGYQAPKASQA